MASIPTSTLIVQRFASALYGVQVGSTTMAAVNRDIASNGLNATLNSYFAASFGSMSSTDVGTLLVANLGIPAAGAAEAIAYVVGKLNGVAAGAKGAVIAGILADFSNLTANATYGAAATAWNTAVDAAAAYTGTADVAVGSVVSTFTLTTGVDTVAGTVGNDTINATLNYDAANSVANGTLSTLDTIDGGAGSNVLNVTDVYGGQVLPTSVSIKNVQTVNVVSAGQVGASTAARLDVSGLTSVTALNVTRSYDNNYIQAGDGQAVNVSGGAATKTVDVVATTGAVNVSAAGGVTVAGGSTQTVTTKGGVNLTGATGAVVATDTAQGSADQVIKDGTSNTLTTTVALDHTVNTQAGVNLSNHSKVTIGATSHLPTGAVTLTENIVGDKAANAWAGKVQINGGSVVNATQAATQAIATQSTTAGATTANFTATQAEVTVNGSTATTAVTVNQTAAVAKVDSVTAKAGVQEVDTVTISSTLADGSSVIVGGLTFTNNSGAALTAAQVAAAFANLTSGATHGTSTKGVYSGTFATGWTTGAVTNTSATASTVTATATTAADANSATITSTGASVALTTAGVAAVTAVAGVGGIAVGDVYVNDYGWNDATKADSITNVTLNGYASGYIKSDALTTLSLANAKDAGVDIDNATATALSVTLNNVTATTAGTGSYLEIDNGSAEYKTLALTATGANSTIKVTGAAVETLTVAGDKSVNLTSSVLTNLKTVTISGSAGVTAASAFTGTAVTDVNASGTSGAVSASIDSSKATYEGSTGADTITLTSTTVSKAVALGAGNDTLNLAAGTTSLTAVVDGGADTDTLGMAAADAATASLNNLFMSKFTGFEKLSLGQVAAGATNSVDLSNMNGLSYVVSSNAVSAATALTVAITQGSAGTTTESAAITFKALTAGQSTTVAGRTVSATGDATAAQVAAVMKSGTAAGNLTVSGSVTGWTMGTVSGADLTFTSTTATTNVTDISTSSSAAGALTVTKMANNGTLELTAAGTGATVTMTDATGTADSLNVVTKVGSSDISFGTVAAAGVETVNITATDTSPVNTTTGAATISKATLTVSDTAAKTVVISGNSDLDLTAAGSALTTVNASAFTGKLSFSSAVDNAVVTGGSAADVLTATGNGQTLNGGAGADTLIVTGNLTTLTGGAGNDTFDVSDATSNVNNYATITDLAAGDSIKFNSNSTAFSTAKVTLADTAVFQDYANAAIANSAQYAVSWFQYGGNTYIVQDVSNSTTTFTNGTDLIVKIAGVVDLSTATFNTTTDTLYI